MAAEHSQPGPPDDVRPVPLSAGYGPYAYRCRAAVPAGRPTLSGGDGPAVPGRALQGVLDHRDQDVTYRGPVPRVAQQHRDPGVEIEGGLHGLGGNSPPRRSS